jgi:hypothetical protein
MEDKPLQSDVFNKAQWAITFYYVEYKILMELFVNRVNFFVWGSTTKKIKDGS